MRELHERRGPLATYEFQQRPAGMGQGAEGTGRPEGPVSLANSAGCYPFLCHVFGRRPGAGMGCRGSFGRASLPGSATDRDAAGASWHRQTPSRQDFYSVYHGVARVSRTGGLFAIGFVVSMALGGCMGSDNLRDARGTVWDVQRTENSVNRIQMGGFSPSAVLDLGVTALEAIGRWAGGGTQSSGIPLP
jgi:hypothetical protein